MNQTRLWRRLLPLLVILVAFAARTWQLDAVPPGWSDDELSNIFVISRKVFAGDFSVYYTDATGLEAPYHVIAGVMLRLFGMNAVGIRLLSAVLGTLTVPLTYQVGKSLFGGRVGLLAAAALAVSFWSLIYSRVNLRHISLPVMALATFFWFWTAIMGETGDRRLQTMDRDLQSPFIIAGLLLGLSLYTYFAARGLPLILGAFVLYVALFDGERWRQRRRGVAVAFLLAFLVTLPLVITVAQAPGADARVAEVAVPVVEAQKGNFEPLLRHTRVTLSMFHADGDDEHLYNIPTRPVFGPAGAIFLWSGVLIAAWLALQPLRRRLAPHEAPESHKQELGAALLLLWWAAGISPGFLSVPPASLGHTILAQPATYLLTMLPLPWLGQALSKAGKVRQGTVVTVAGMLLVASVAWRDLPDYFVRWPEQGMVRFLYHADVRDVAHSLAEHDGPYDFAIAGLLAGPWDRLALDLALQNAGVQEARPRWYDPRHAVFLALSGETAPTFHGFPRVAQAYEDVLEPTGREAGAYDLALARDGALPDAPLACFDNDLCLMETTYDCDNGLLDLTWQVVAPLPLPPLPLISKPPPPGIYDGPRLSVFAHLWDADGDFMSGDDGLWVDPTTLQAGDVFRQRHRLEAASETSAGYLLVGLYDPMNGERILTGEGRDRVRLEPSCWDGQ